jgi:hypothetical protein
MGPKTNKNIKAQEQTLKLQQENIAAAEAARPKQTITPQIKKDPHFQNGLAELARGDAQHDFKDLTWGQTEVNILNQGLPNIAVRESHFHETEMLYFVFSDCPVTNTKKGRDDAVDAFLRTIPDVNENGDIAKKPLKIGYRDNNLSPIEKPLYNYTGVRFNIYTANNKDYAKYGKPVDKNWGKNFVTNALGGREAAFIVDFSQHHFMEKLVEGTKYNDFTVHYLMTPEVVNDPAGKPNVDNKSLFQTDTGINLYSYVQRDIDPACYTPFDVNESNPLNNFFSKYDYTISPIKQIYTKGKSSQLVTTLDVKFTSGTTQPYTAIIEDSKKENSITNVLGYITKILLQLNKDTTSPQLVFNFNVKCQQKRGGDWFQVLCCLDARKRTYTRILPNDPNRYEWNIPEKCPVYFVSHDQIAVAYALLNGVNVIYLDAFGRIFVFKNQADPSLEGTGKPIAEILFDGIKARLDSLGDLIIWSKNYSEFRKKIIVDETKTYNDALVFASAEIQRLDSKNVSGYTKGISKIFANIFSAAVRLMFVKINFIDVTSQTKFLSDVMNSSLLKNTFPNGEVAHKNIHKCSDYINLIYGVIKKYGNIPLDTDDSFKTKMQTWVTNNVKNLDVFRAAQNIDLTRNSENHTVKEQLINFVKRSAFNNNEHLRSTNKYIFLPFIQTLSSNNDTSKTTNELSELINLLNTDVKKSLDSFLEQQSTSNIKGIIQTMKRATRSGLDPTNTFYNNAINLIYESNILLKIEESDTGFLDTEDVPFLDSTDNIIIGEDDHEIAELNKGKISFYNAIENGSNENASNEGDVIQQGGVTFYSMTDPTLRKSTGKFKPVVCDITIRQITWPLLSAYFVDNMTPDTALKLAEAFIKYKSDNNITQNNLQEYLKENGFAIFSFLAQNSLFSVTMVDLKKEQGQLVVKELKEKIPQDLYPDRNEIGAVIVATGASIACDVAYLTPALTVLGVSPLLPVITAVTITAAGIYAYRKYTNANRHNTQPTIGPPKKGGGRDDDEDYDIEMVPMAASANEIDASANEIGTSTIEIGTVIEGVGNQDPKDDEFAANLLKDFNLCYHPLVPIYMILSPFYYTLGPKYENYPFLYSYFTYFNVLEKMVDVINNNYLNDPLDGINIFAAYYIGRGLGTFLITSNTSIEQNNKILEIIGMTQEEYYTFSLTTASFANLFIGSVHSTPEEEAVGISFINNQLFKNFINEEVNIKGILQSEPTEGISESSPTEGIPSYMKLKQKVRDLIHKIAVKVNADRGTPLDAEIDDAIAAGIKIPDDTIVEDIQTPDTVIVEDIQRPDTAIVEDIQRPDDANKQKMINFRFKRPGNRLPLTAIPSIRVRGGKMTKNRCKKKYGTRKKKSGKHIKISKKTRKHKRSHKRSRKNLN